MLLPNNGKVVVIDDKIDEVKTLLSGLSSEGVPYLYYQDEGLSDMPSKPIANVRVLILDLLLVSDQSQTATQVVATIYARLKRVLSTANGPYILLYWSTKEKEYGDAVKKALRSGPLKKYKPLLIMSLPKHSTYAQVTKALKDRFEKFKAMNPLMLFESMANEAAGELVNMFSGLHPMNKDWNEQLTSLLGKSAIAWTGKDGYASIDNASRIKKALATVSSTLEERTIAKLQLSDTTGFGVTLAAAPPSNGKIASAMNAHLHISDCSDDSPSTGNVHIVSYQRKKLESLWARLRDKPATALPKEARMVMVDITPSCDYAQPKDYSRFVFGIMLPEAKVRLAKSTLPDFLTRLPMMRNQKRTFRLFIDSRYLTTESATMRSELKRKAYCRLNKAIMADLLADVSKHLNRPGYLSLV